MSTTSTGSIVYVVATVSRSSLPLLCTLFPVLPLCDHNKMQNILALIFFSNWKTVLLPTATSLHDLASSYHIVNRTNSAAHVQNAFFLHQCNGMFSTPAWFPQVASTVRLFQSEIIAARLVANYDSRIRPEFSGFFHISMNAFFESSAPPNPPLRTRVGLYVNHV